MKNKFIKSLYETGFGLAIGISGGLVVWASLNQDNLNVPALSVLYIVIWMLLALVNYYWNKKIL